MIPARVGSKTSSATQRLVPTTGSRGLGFLRAGLAACLGESVSVATALVACQNGAIDPVSSATTPSAPPSSVGPRPDPLKFIRLPPATRRRRSHSDAHPVIQHGFAAWGRHQQKHWAAWGSHPHRNTVTLGRSDQPDLGFVASGSELIGGIVPSRMDVVGAGSLFDRPRTPMRGRMLRMEWRRIPRPGCPDRETDVLVRSAKHGRRLGAPLVRRNRGNP